MRRFGHFMLVTMGIVPWLAAMLCMSVATLFAVLAYKVDPRAQRGNCWSYALPRWALRGGYLLVRLTDRPRIFGKRFIPHAIWMRSLHPETELRQTDPLHRKFKAHQVLWHVWYFRYRIVEREAHPRRSDWMGL